MNGQIRFAVRLPHTWCIADTDSIVQVVDLAEELGFWGVSVQDHLLSDSSVSPCGSAHAGDDRNVFELLQVLAFTAGRTDRIKLVAGVVVLPFHDPILLAKELATLDVLSRGRLIAGVGVGALVGRKEDSGQRLEGHRQIAVKEFEVLKISGNRGPVVDESIQAMTALWTQDRASFHGATVSFDDLEMYPKPVQKPRPPILIGGRSAAAERRVALLADGWFPSQATAAGLEAGRGRIEAMAQEAGRPTDGFDWGVNIFAAVDRSDGDARQAMRDSLGRRFEGDEPLFAATIAGDAAAFAQRVDEYAAAGCGFLDLKFVPLTLADTLDQMRFVMREVAPRVEDLAAARLAHRKEA
ncbi:MAG: TIGR03619 family F420-dependent LLM class oxidoreductase [Candidatus Limnocylindrales bacterium]